MGVCASRKFIRGLHTLLQQLADRQLVWRKLPNSLIVPADLDTDSYLSKYHYRFIFFRKPSTELIGIMSILHERADIPVRLTSDLRLMLEESK